MLKIFSPASSKLPVCLSVYDVEYILKCFTSSGRNSPSPDTGDFLLYLVKFLWSSADKLISARNWKREFTLNWDLWSNIIIFQMLRSRSRCLALSICLLNLSDKGNSCKINNLSENYTITHNLFQPELVCFIFYQLFVLTCFILLCFTIWILTDSFTWLRGVFMIEFSGEYHNWDLNIPQPSYEVTKFSDWSFRSSNIFSPVRLQETISQWNTANMCSQLAIN